MPANVPEGLSTCTLRCRQGDWCMAQRCTHTPVRAHSFRSNKGVTIKMQHEKIIIKGLLNYLTGEGMAGSSLNISLKWVESDQWRRTSQQPVCQSNSLVTVRCCQAPMHKKTHTKIALELKRECQMKAPEPGCTSTYVCWSCNIQRSYSFNTNKS